MKDEKVKLSRHLQECLNEILAGKKKTFEPMDFYPRIKRGDWVFKQLKDAGWIKRHGDKYKLKTNPPC